MTKIPEWLKPYEPKASHPNAVGHGWVRIEYEYRDELMAKILLLYPGSKIIAVTPLGTTGIANYGGELVLWGRTRTMIDMELL